MTEPIGALRAELSATSAQFAADMGKAREQLSLTNTAFAKLGVNVEKVDKAFAHYFSTTAFVTNGIRSFGYALSSLAWGTVVGAAIGLTLVLANQAKEWLRLESAVANVNRRLKENSVTMVESLKKQRDETALALQNLADSTQRTFWDRFKEGLFGAMVGMSAVGTVANDTDDKMAALGRRLQEIQRLFLALTPPKDALDPEKLGLSANLWKRATALLKEDTVAYQELFRQLREGKKLYEALAIAEKSVQDPEKIAISNDLWKRANALLKSSTFAYQDLFARLRAGEPLYKAIAGAEKDQANALTGEKIALDAATSSWDDYLRTQKELLQIEKSRLASQSLARLQSGINPPPLTPGGGIGSPEAKGFLDQLMDLQPQLSTAQLAFDALSSSIATIGSAFITAMQGGESFGKSLKKSVAFTAASIAIQSFLWALFDTALGLSYLAMGNEVQAAAAFAAAEKMALTGAIAGTFAAATGGFSGGGGAAATGGPYQMKQSEPATEVTVNINAATLNQQAVDSLTAQLIPAIAQQLQDSGGRGGNIDFNIRRL